MAHDETHRLGKVTCIGCKSRNSDTTWELVTEDNDREAFHVECESCGNSADVVNKKGFNPDMAINGDVEPVSGLVGMHTGA